MSGETPSPHSDDLQPVSVIIPCYNAERWVGEAIQSVLDQNYPDIEVIVIDDGSVDGSLDIVKSFGSAVCWEAGPNRGACAARNRGFELARSRFIQFLDADDMLLPGKIEGQARVLQSGGGMAVYGDWQHQHHDADGRVWLDAPKISGRPPDILKALIEGWWVPSMALMFRREIVEKIGGWDETLPAAQDRDFFLRVAMATDAILYEPGCCAIYRRYGPVTVSTACTERYARSHYRVVQKTESALAGCGWIDAGYRAALAQAYFHLARLLFAYDRALAADIVRHAHELTPDFRPRETRLYNMAFASLGFCAAEELAALSRHMRRRAVAGH